ncbi:hypothetical protein DFH11DRAFT_1549812 [Phellopilus nigrolimitatus]|nr:hypothetical protein DFH11DRAFT_1549812 [Phellopilus nigrolimitatus]
MCSGGVRVGCLVMLERGRYLAVLARFGPGALTHTTSYCSSASSDIHRILSVLPYSASHTRAPTLCSSSPKFFSYAYVCNPFGSVLHDARVSTPNFNQKQDTGGRRREIVGSMQASGASFLRTYAARPRVQTTIGSLQSASKGSGRIREIVLSGVGAETRYDTPRRIITSSASAAAAAVQADFPPCRWHSALWQQLWKFA